MSNNVQIASIVSPVAWCSALLFLATLTGCPDEKKDGHDAAAPAVSSAPSVTPPANTLTQPASATPSASAPPSADAGAPADAGAKDAKDAGAKPASATPPAKK